MEEIDGVVVNLGAFLDAVMLGGYYSYEGSLTTPSIKVIYSLLYDS